MSTATTSLLTPGALGTQKPFSDYVHDISSVLTGFSREIALNCHSIRQQLEDAFFLFGKWNRKGRTRKSAGDSEKGGDTPTSKSKGRNGSAKNYEQGRKLTKQEVQRKKAQKKEEQLRQQREQKNREEELRKREEQNNNL